MGLSGRLPLKYALEHLHSNHGPILPGGNAAFRTYCLVEEKA